MDAELEEKIKDSLAANEKREKPIALETLAGFYGVEVEEIKVLQGEMVEKVEDPVDDTEKELQEIKVMLKNSLRRGNATAGKVLLQLMGKLNETGKERKDGLNADEIARRNIEADRELRKEQSKRGYRMEKVSARLRLLSGKIRQDKG